MNDKKDYSDYWANSQAPSSDSQRTILIGYEYDDEGYLHHIPYVAPPRTPFWKDWKVIVSFAAYILFMWILLPLNGRVATGIENIGYWQCVLISHFQAAGILFFAGCWLGVCAAIGGALGGLGR